MNSGKPDDSGALQPVDTAVGACDAGDAPIAVIVPPDPTCHGEGTAAAPSPSTKWAWADNPLQPGPGQVMSTPVVGDLDGDGLPELCEAFHARGDLPWTAAAGTGYRTSFAAHMDADPELGVVAGNTVYDTDDTVLWPAAVGDGFAGMADFDNDGFPHVGVAGYDRYPVFDALGRELRHVPTQDDSSSATARPWRARTPAMRRGPRSSTRCSRMETGTRSSTWSSPRSTTTSTAAGRASRCPPIPAGRCRGVPSGTSTPSRSPT